MSANGLNVLVSARVGGDERPPRLPGFIVSDFAPLVYAAVRECLGTPRPADAPDGERTGIVLSSVRFDTVTLELSVEQTREQRVSPILFYQALPTAALGQIARDHHLTGPMSCVAATGDPREEALEVARLMLADGSVDRVVAVVVSLADDAADSFASADLVTLARPA